MRNSLAIVVLILVGGCSAYPQDNRYRFERLSDNYFYVFDTKTGAMWQPSKDHPWAEVQPATHPSNTSDSPPVAVQSVRSDARVTGEGLIAHSVEQDLASFKKSWEEGLLTKEEYQQARNHVLGGIPERIRQALVNGRYSPERIHEELAYVARMKKEGELSDEEYELGRKAFVNGFVLQQ